MSRAPGPPFVDLTEGYETYFERHRLLAPRALPMIGEAPVWMTPAERLLLWSLVYALRPRAYVEIGSLAGGSALLVASALDAAGAPGRLVLVEPEPQIAPEVWERLAARTTLVRGRSPAALDAARQAAEADFDLALVDGDHSVHAVRADARGLVPHLADGAWILFHDAHLPGVAAGIDRFVAGDPERRRDLGLVTREYTIGRDAEGDHVWGGLRAVVVRR